MGHYGARVQCCTESDALLTHRGHVEREDLELFLSKERAKQCFEVLDVDNNGQVRSTRRLLTTQAFSMQLRDAQIDQIRRAVVCMKA